VGVIIERATARAEAILDGSYDFSQDEDESESETEAAEDSDVAMEEEPEESEEERAKREKKEKYLKIFDTISTWGLGIAVVAVVGYMIYKLIF